ncbi:MULTISPECIES: TetR/AcrR family transcriptional regulator [Paraburkholderia]|jgi:AcrR family transcriptional regulator|uniref:Transcriptional regulator, TetR family n=1 Tax=Paraburkholderia phenazinium TaxID=60549 RepID=A0A1N6IL72_9BURK|nr:TetR/AcrR family transcriptional regulator [Paraburkholderia phenazinium]SIO32788.1 transcriptional regulator, TetR family [Paraburkholderia phenazinium]
MTTPPSDERPSKAAAAGGKKKAPRAAGAASAARAAPTAATQDPAAAPLAARRPGRPTGSARGPEQRARLLDAALALFARQGIVDTSLGAIAREAGFTPAMVHYYFKTRDQLLDVLIDERFLPLRTAIGGAFEANPDDPVAAITQMARGMVAVAVENPWFPPLWVREVISEGGLLRQRMHERFGHTHHKASLARIEQWQKEGRVNADLEPSLVFLTLLGLTILPLATSKMWRNDPVRRSLTPDDIARHAVALLVHGLAPAQT